MKPMADYIQRHPKLEEQHVLWVEMTQSRTQTHGRRPVYQHVQHASQLGTYKTPNFTVKPVLSYHIYKSRHIYGF